MKMPKTELRKEIEKIKELVIIHPKSGKIAYRDDFTDLLLSLFHKERVKWIKKIEKELTGFDDGKRTSKERQLIYKFEKLIRRS